jgi:hypothetical protein
VVDWLSGTAGVSAARGAAKGTVMDGFVLQVLGTVGLLVLLVVEAWVRE